MQRKPITIALAFAGAVGLAGAVPAFAADTGGSTNSKTGANAAAHSGTAMQSPSGATGNTGMSGSDDWNTWYETHSKANSGRISRKAYMDEMGRRWDSMDKTQQGLTPAEVSRMTGHVDSGAMPSQTGSGVQPGNMGPGNQKGK